MRSVGFEMPPVQSSLSQANAREQLILVRSWSMAISPHVSSPSPSKADHCRVWEPISAAAETDTCTSSTFTT